MDVIKPNLKRKPDGKETKEPKKQKSLHDFAASDPAFQKAIALKDSAKDWSVFTETDTKVVAEFFSLVLSGSDTSAISVRSSDTHFVAHLSDLMGKLTLEDLEAAMRKLNTRYQVGQTVLNLSRRFIDARFKFTSGLLRTVDISNVICVGTRTLFPHIARQIKGSTEREPMDWALLATLYTHAENLLGEETPESLTIEIDTPDGLTLLGDKEPIKNVKGKRSNYEFNIKGYTTIDTANLRSFAHIAPFHVHTPTVHWATGTVSVLVEPYSKPLIGKPFDFFDDTAASFLGASTAATGGRA